MASARRKAFRVGRRAVAEGQRPRYRVELDDRVIPDMPWLEFDGARPPEIAEAARRAIAAELQVRPDQVEVEPAARSFEVKDHAPWRTSITRGSSGADDSSPVS